MTNNEIFTVISVTVGIVISIVNLIMFASTKKIQNKTYNILLDGYRSSSIDLAFVSAGRGDEGVLAKLCLFNPSQVACIIKSLSVERRSESSNFFYRLIGKPDWHVIDEVKWWPVEDPTCLERKYYQDEYKSLYVKSIRDIYVNMPEIDSGAIYRFIVKTNLRNYSQSLQISFEKGNFPCDYQQWFHED